MECQKEDIININRKTLINKSYEITIDIPILEEKESCHSSIDLCKALAIEF